MTRRGIVPFVLVSALSATAACRRPPDEGRRSAEQGSAAPPTETSPTKQEPAGTTQIRSGEPLADRGAKGGPSNLPPFEGELKVDVRGKAPESVDYAMKGDKIRIGLGGKAGEPDKGVDAIVDTSNRKATILLNDRKEFIEVDLDKLANKAKERVEQMDVEATGKTSIVAGRTCEEWKIRDRALNVSACVFKGAPYFDLAALEEQGKFTAPPWLHKIVDAGYVPLRVTVADASGKQLGSSEVTDASRKVDTSRFEVPKDYKRTDASKLPGAKR